VADNGQYIPSGEYGLKALAPVTSIAFFNPFNKTALSLPD